MKITIDGVRIGYDAAGSGDAIVLLHGYLLDRSVWDEQFAGLAVRCRVVRLDFRGAGESGEGAGPALMEMLAGDVCGLLDALEIERAIIVGHGLGGYAALAFFRMYTERVAGLALIASDVTDATAERRIESDALAAAIDTRGIGAAVEAYLPRALAAAAAQPLVERTRAMMVRQPAAGAAALLRGMQQRVDSSDLLEDIAVPVTIIAGAQDAWVAIGAAQRTAAAIASCEFVPLADTGHLPMLEAPRATLTALAALAERCVRPAVSQQSARATPA